MNVLFIEKKLRTDKLGIMYISAVLKQEGHHVYLIQDDVESSEEYLSKNSIDVICWSMMSCDSTWMLNKNKSLKKKFKFISIIGGPHPTFFPEEGINDPNVDYVIIGSGECVINKILNNEITTKSIRGNIPDINKLPFPDRSIQYRYDEFGKARAKRFMGGRYCYYSCKYCFNSQFKKIYSDQIKSLWNRHNVELLMKELDDVKCEYGLEHAIFNDDDIAANKSWLIEFCQEIKKRNIGWSCLISASSVDFNILKLMKNSGCEFISLAIESANKETQKFLNRKFLTTEDVEQAVKWAISLGLKVRLLNIIGLPVKDPLEDAFETLRFNQKINPTESIISIFQPYRGTELWEYCIKEGLITENTICGTFFENTSLNIQNSNKINSLYHWWPYAVRYNMPIDLVKILIDINISPDIQDKLQKYKWEWGSRNFFKI